MELARKTRNSIYGIVKQKGYVSFLDVLFSLEKLSQEDYEKWRRGQVSYLERVIRGNLGQFSFMLREYRAYCLKLGLEPSWTGYNKWGKGSKKRLRFSKSGNEHVEKAYATHYVVRKQRDGSHASFGP